MRSFKSNENIHKKEGGSYYVVSAKFSDRQIWANSADPDQISRSDQGLHCLQFPLHLLDALL